MFIVDTVSISGSSARSNIDSISHSSEKASVVSLGEDTHIGQPGRNPLESPAISVSVVIFETLRCIGKCQEGERTDWLANGGPG